MPELPLALLVPEEEPPDAAPDDPLLLDGPEDELSVPFEPLPEEEGTATAASLPHVQGPRPLPSGLHTWKPMQAPGPAQARDAPGVHCVNAFPEPLQFTTKTSAAPATKIAIPVHALRIRRPLGLEYPFGGVEPTLSACERA
jgi:hypothetical protein